MSILGLDLTNLNTLYVSCFASQGSFCLYERPLKIMSLIHFTMCKVICTQIFKTDLHSKTIVFQYTDTKLSHLLITNMSDEHTHTSYIYVTFLRDAR